MLSFVLRISPDMADHLYTTRNMPLWQWEIGLRLTLVRVGFMFYLDCSLLLRTLVSSLFWWDECSWAFYHQVTG